MPTVKSILVFICIKLNPPEQADGEAGNGKWLVQDQYPKPGMTVGKGTTIYLYRE